MSMSSAAAADGAGLTVDGASATLLYRSTGDKFVFNKPLEATSFSGTIALTNLDIDGGTDIGEALVDADLMIVDNGAGGTNRKATMARLKTYMQNGLTFTTNTNTMGSGFTVSATTDSNSTTITQGDDLFFAAGTGITCETTADGTVTITNTVTNTNTQLAIASTAEAEAGADDTKAMTAAKVADRSVLATIDVSDSTFQSNLYAEINHGLGTADIIVQLYDINTEETVIADVFRTDKAGTASTDKIKIVFSAAPAAANDIRVLITSLKGGQTGTVAYS